MLTQNFSIKPLIEILFKVLKKSSNYFADAYLLKDVSLISKWKTGKVIPKNEDISKLVEFVNNESTEMQRHLIRLKMEEYINESFLDVSLKNMLIEFEDFTTFLTETLIMSVSDTNTYEISDTNTPSEDGASTLEDDLEENEAIDVDEISVNEISKSSNNFHGFFRTLSKCFKKPITKIVLLLIIVFMAILMFQQFLGYKNSDVLNQTDLSSEKNSITLSDKYILSYTHIKNSKDEVQVDINNNPIMFNNLSAKLIDGVLYLPLGETLKGLGFTFISYNGGTQTYKEISSGKTVITKVDTKKLIINDRKIKLQDPIINGESDVYAPAYVLVAFCEYIERIIPQSIDIKVGDKAAEEYPFKPRIVGNNLYLPFRQIFEMFDYKVDPDRKTQSVAQRAIAKKDGTIIEIEESKNFIMVNDEVLTLSGLVFMSSNTTYVPVDIIKQALNKNYTWNKEQKILQIEN